VADEPSARWVTLDLARAKDYDVKMEDVIGSAAVLQAAEATVRR